MFVEDDELPVSEATTLFDGEMVYHFMKEPAQTIIYRAPGANRDGEFLILDLDREQRTDISTKRIGGLMNKLNRWAAEQEDTLLKFSAQPIFEEEFDEETGILTMENPAWNYTVATVAAEDEKAMLRYRDFTDWYSRLNAMLHSTPPPGARLALNKAYFRSTPWCRWKSAAASSRRTRACVPRIYLRGVCRGKTANGSTPPAANWPASKRWATPSSSPAARKKPLCVANRSSGIAKPLLGFRLPRSSRAALVAVVELFLQEFR